MDTSYGLDGLSGKTAVVTGASRGIGAAIAQALATAGANVVLSARDGATLTAASDAITDSGGVASWVVADVTDPDQLAHLRVAAEQRYGPVALLVANAGGDGRPAPIGQLDPATWRATVELNLTSVFLTLREFVPPMIERRDGAVVTISSAAARVVTPASPAYAAAKAGVLSLTAYVAAEAAPSGVRVNALAPGTVATDAIGRLPDPVQAGLRAQHPSGRLGTVTDIADAALFLLSGNSTWITGHTLDLGARVMT
jgi:3-oxoacyl-[acyl-carrier protein] reductase